MFQSANFEQKKKGEGGEGSESWQDFTKKLSTSQIGMTCASYPATDKTVPVLIQIPSVTAVSLDD